MKREKYAVFTIDVEDFADTECVAKSGQRVRRHMLDGLDIYIRLLEQYQIRATMFAVCRTALREQERVQRYVDRGHRLALHGLEHVPPCGMDDEHFRRATLAGKQHPRKKPCSESPCTEKPYTVNPDTDAPVTENPAQLSTNRTSTETIHKREKKEIQHRYGSYENVLLSDTEYGKLRQEFPGDYQMRVERLSEYMASTGRSYKNHLATIRSWAKREKPKYNPADYTFEEGDSL